MGKKKSTERNTENTDDNCDTVTNNIHTDRRLDKNDKKYKPFVSICTPTYNRRPFIPFMLKCFPTRITPWIEWSGLLLTMVLTPLKI